jgi:hypothetical protein
MTDRMTDERLAEIDKRWVDGWMLDKDGDFLIESLKADRKRISELESALRDIKWEAESCAGSFPWIVEKVNEVLNDD